ncbi:hypothetical protein LXL04_028882 [Taraxacum kok-saghyz]
MQGDPPKCRFRYPRQFNESTTQGEDAYPVYRRRNTGITVKKQGVVMDNRSVVPYNPKMLMMFNCHINVEVCSSITSVKYVFKYIYKGHDKQVIQVDPNAQHVVVNEIRRFQDARYVSLPEAIWRIFSFPLSKISPNVVALQVHLPNQQLVRFSNDDTMTTIVEREKNKRSMLTAFFDRNKEDMSARQCLYKDFPKHFTWNNKDRLWNPRKRGSVVRRLVSANPAKGERYYLRLLLCHVTGPTSFEDLYTFNNIKYPTFRKATLERGIIESDESLSQCLAEKSLFQFPNALRRLFATILVFCDPGDVRKLWNDHYIALLEDYVRQFGNAARVQNMVLTDITLFLQSMGRNLRDFDLPTVNTDINVQSGVFREVLEESSIIVEDDHLRANQFLNTAQKYAYDEIMRHALLATICKSGHIALATASSGVAANNMPGGRTAHSRFKIPLNLDNNSMCNIKKQSGTSQLLRSARIILWDKASMAKRQAIEAFDRTMQDITGVSLLFGGKILVMGGDFRQVLPVVRRGTRAQIVDSSLRMSPLWSSIIKLRLTTNMRAQTDPWFSDFLLRVGDGVEGSDDGRKIRIPADMVIPYTDKTKSLDALIDAVFPSLESNMSDSDYVVSRAILSTKNDSVDEINDYLIDRFHGEEKIYYSFDEAIDDRNGFYSVEFLNSITVGGLPLITSALKTFQRNVIDAEIAVGQHAGKRVFLPKIPLSPSDDDMFPFKLKRKQFPMRLCFAMTINKAQGQTIPNVGVYLPDPVFSHGQLYVALSRGISRANTKVLVRPHEKTNDDEVYTSNVVYKEVLSD